MRGRHVRRGDGLRSRMVLRVMAWMFALAVPAASVLSLFMLSVVALSLPAQAAGAVSGASGSKVAASGQSGAAVTTAETKGAITLESEEKTTDAQSSGAAVADVEHGRKIFETICSHCHRTDYETSAVGAPGLRDVMERHTPEWEDQWLTSPVDFAKRDETAKALVESNPYGLIMPTLPEMQDPKNRRDVIEFLKTLTSKD